MPRISVQSMARLALTTIIPWCVLTTLYFTSKLQQKHHDDHLEQSRRRQGGGRHLRLDSLQDRSDERFSAKSELGEGVVPDSIVFFPDSVPTSSTKRLESEGVDDGNDAQTIVKTDDGLSSMLSTKSPAVASESHSPPACDLLPIEGGRFMFRNRVRIADTALTHICGPRVLFIGAQRCGTDTVADLLLNHPRVVVNQCSLINTKGGPLSCHPPWFQRTKQGNYFNVPDLTHHRRNDPESWLNMLARRMPLTDGINTTTFEKSPTYMETQIFEDVAKTAYDILPNAKIVATLCHPAERLYSEFHRPGPLHQFYLDNDIDPPQDFAQFVDLLKPTNPICSDIDNAGFCETNRKMYLSKGEYIDSLRPWIHTYGPKNVLILNMDDPPERIVHQLLQHVDLPEDEYPWEILSTTNVFRNRNGRYEGRSSGYKYFESRMRWLEEYYSPYNDALSDYLKSIHGDDENDSSGSSKNDWPSQWNCRHFPEAPYCNDRSREVGRIDLLS